MVAHSVHLVGSVPLNSARDVMQTAAVHLGEHLCRVPDGETGERTNWIVWQLEKLAACPQLEMSRDAGSEYAQSTRIRIREGLSASDVALPSLGYADAALTSFATFQSLQSAGELPARWRFQVCLPTPIATVHLYVQPEHQAAFEPVYAAAMLKELQQILVAIPHEKLAIQWDTAVEFGVLEGVFPTYLEHPQADILERLETLGNAVPEAVELGYHLCYGDAGHKHFCEPQDASKLVAVANGVFSKLARPVNWLHLPVPRERDDAAYFAPLTELNLPAETELYLGLVHLTDGAEGLQRRSSAAAQVVPRFGVATECGFGRRPQAVVPELMALHSQE